MLSDSIGSETVVKGPKLAAEVETNALIMIAGRADGLSGS